MWEQRHGKSVHLRLGTQDVLAEQRKSQGETAALRKRYRVEKSIPKGKEETKKPKALAVLGARTPPSWEESFSDERRTPLAGTCTHAAKKERVLRAHQKCDPCAQMGGRGKKRLRARSTRDPSPAST